jgi:hypothetical protein
MRRPVVMALAVLTLTVGAPSALARGDDWQKVRIPHRFQVECPSGLVTLTVVANKEYFRVEKLPNGTFALTVTGALKYRITNRETGQSIVVNASGPSVGQHRVIVGGQFEFRATGNNILFLTKRQAAQARLPMIFTSHGPIDIVFKGRRVRVVDVPNKVTDICAEVGAE